MFNNLVINSEILKYCVKLGGQCGPQVYIVQFMNGEKQLTEQKKRNYLPFFSPVCLSSNISTSVSGKEVIERQDILGVFCLSITKDKRRSA